MIGSLTRSSLANKKQYRSLLAGNEPVSYGAYELISSTVLSSSTSSVTFSSIAQTYKHLQVRYTARGDASTEKGDLVLLLNGDTGSNYSRHHLQGSGSSVGSYSGTSQSSIVFFDAWAGATATANNFASGVVDVLDFASSSKYKTTRAFTGFVGTATRVTMNSGLWMSTTAVSSLQLSPNTGNFVSGSRFSLYGIKG